MKRLDRFVNPYFFLVQLSAERLVLRGGEL